MPPSLPTTKPCYCNSLIIGLYLYILLKNKRKKNKSDHIHQWLIFFTQSNSQILYNGLQNMIQSLTTSTLPFSPFCTSNTLSKLLPQDLCTYFPSIRGFLLPQISAGRLLVGWLPQTIQIFAQILPSQWDLALHHILKCSPNLSPSTLHATSLLYFVYTFNIWYTTLFFCFHYHYLTLPTTM